MYGNENTKREVELLRNAISRIEAKCAREGRQPLPVERNLLSEMRNQADVVERSMPQKPLSMPGADLGASVRRDGAYALVAPNGPKDYRSLFGSGDYQWPSKDTNFFGAVLSGRHHEGLIRNSMSETVPSDGGFLVPGETASRIHSVSLENELVMPRCFVQPMRGNSIKIPAMSIGDHSSALFGGFTASYVDEASTISEANPKSRAMELVAKKLTGLIRFSSELNADVPGGMSQIEQICGKGLAWYRDKFFLKGKGAGEPLGILNADCTIQVSASVGQAADTILYENLTSMMSRMFAGSFANSVWVCHQSTIPQLLSLSLAVGTGGDHIPVMTESNGQFQILTRPCVFTEKTEKLGEKGDIMLADFSQYVVGLRTGMRFDTSIHPHFTTDELLSRIIERHDGQPLWDSSLTLEDGSTTVSPFVVLAERA
jgi:HK97 family phage major capsid protein